MCVASVHSCCMLPADETDDDYECVYVHSPHNVRRASSEIRRRNELIGLSHV